MVQKDEAVVQEMNELGNCADKFDVEHGVKFLGAHNEVAIDML